MKTKVLSLVFTLILCPAFASWDCPNPNEVTINGEEKNLYANLYKSRDISNLGDCNLEVVCGPGFVNGEKALFFGFLKNGIGSYCDFYMLENEDLSYGLDRRKYVEYIMTSSDTHFSYTEKYDITGEPLTPPYKDVCKLKFEQGRLYHLSITDWIFYIYPKNKTYCAESS